VIIKQNMPQDDDSSMFEVFNRLNTGGINLTPQEIRTSMYHSSFYDMLYRENSRPAWRHLLGNQEPDLHMKDIEILLRGFAMLVDGHIYAPSMVRFLNQFSRKCKSQSSEQNAYLANLFDSFLLACKDLPEGAFLNKQNRRFNVALYEVVFAAICGPSFAKGESLPSGTLSSELLANLETDRQFLETLVEGTTQTRSVRTRLDRARALLGSSFE